VDKFYCIEKKYLEAKQNRSLSNLSQLEQHEIALVERVTLNMGLVEIDLVERGFFKSLVEIALFQELGYTNGGLLNIIISMMVDLNDGLVPLSLDTWEQEAAAEPRHWFR